MGNLGHGDLMSGVIGMRLGSYAGSVSTAGTVGLTDQSVFGAVRAGIQLENTGYVSTTTTGTYSPVGNWITPRSGMAAYDVSATYTGTFPSGALANGTWLNLGTTRQWAIQSPINIYHTCTLTVTIRNTLTFAVVGRAVFYLEADNSRLNTAP